MRAMSIVAFLSAVFVVTPVIADAQTKVLSATDISAAEIQALMGPRKPNTLPNIRVVDAGGHNVMLASVCSTGLRARPKTPPCTSRCRKFTT